MMTAWAVLGGFVLDAIFGDPGAVHSIGKLCFFIKLTC